MKHLSADQAPVFILQRLYFGFSNKKCQCPCSPAASLLLCWNVGFFICSFFVSFFFFFFFWSLDSWRCWMVVVTPRPHPRVLHWLPPRASHRVLPPVVSPSLQKAHPEPLAWKRLQRSRRPSSSKNGCHILAWDHLQQEKVSTGTALLGRCMEQTISLI